MAPIASLIGLGCFLLAFILIAIGFATPYWLETDWRIYGNNNFQYSLTDYQQLGQGGYSPGGYSGAFGADGLASVYNQQGINPLGGRDGVFRKFQNLGLWALCYRPLPYESAFFSNCRWILSYSSVWREGGGTVRNYYLPAYFVAVQCLVTASFVFMMIAFFLVWIHICTCCQRGNGCYRAVTNTLGGLLLLSALLGSIGVIVFGAMGTNTTWVTNGYDNNYMSWSFGLVVVGLIFEWAAAILFLIGGASTDDDRADTVSVCSHCSHMSHNTTMGISLKSNESKV